MAEQKREFRGEQSYAFERAARDAVVPLLHSRGFDVMEDQRAKVGKGESQTIIAQLPTGEPAAIRVRLCWRRDERSTRENLFSAAQLRARTIDGDWDATLRHITERSLEKGVTHFLFYQRDRTRDVLAALVPVEQIAAIWHRQREVSDELIQSGALGRQRKNHAANGHSPTIWLQDDRTPEAHQVSDVLWEWAGVVDVMALPIVRNTQSSIVPTASSRRRKDPQASGDTPQYVARLAYNSLNWQRPVRAEEAQEAGNTYRTENGFGHEDWLFRAEWLLDGWRYGFVQGVNRSRKKLLAEGRPFNLRLFTMPAPGDRRAVAEIRDVECLDDRSAAAAVAAYEELGWLDIMRAEVAEAGGRPEALDENTHVSHVLNLRYRIENVHPLDASAPLPVEDPVRKINRYQLARVEGAMDYAPSAWRGRAGAATLSAAPRKRFMKGGWVTYSPEHVHMQQALMQRLHDLYPEVDPVCEQDFVDVMLKTPEEVLLFEVKSDLSPLSVIRQALGQVLEYAYHPRRAHDLPVRLVIVGRRDLAGDDLAYFEGIKERFSLPIEYWTVAI